MMFNFVIAGNFNNGRVKFDKKDGVYIKKIGMKEIVPINTQTVSKYEIVDEKANESGLKGAIIGDMLFGMPGAILGAYSGKPGYTRIAIEFKNGAKSLLEVNSQMKDHIVKSLFDYSTLEIEKQRTLSEAWQEGYEKIKKRPMTFMLLIGFNILLWGTLIHLFSSAIQ